MPVKLVVGVRLVPDAAQEAALWDTLALCNQAANYASARAFATRVTRMQPLQRLVYGDLKAMGLSAQPAIHVARKVAGAYATLKANIRAGNLGKPGSKRRTKAESQPVRFRPDEPEPAEPDGFLGIDLGITNIVTTSDGIRHAGTHLNRVRRRNRALRRKLQAKGTKSAKRLLRKRSRKETRFVADTNHRIA
jgi:hypothetical protein